VKWLKKGKIFDPTKHNLANGCVEFAQSPQALVFADFIRIYFSTRKKDLEKGKYLSHISFVDMDKAFKKVINLSSHTVIELGNLGCFDEHGIFPMNVVRYKNRIYAYTCGWNRKVSVSVDTSIGFAVSEDDGFTFKKAGDGPILTSSLHEPFLVGDPFVCIFENTFHMWYIYGTQWKRFSDEGAPDRIYKIGHAVSQDGMEWQKDGIRLIEDKFPDESQALPTVIYFNQKYHMYFCYRQSFDFRKNRDRGYRIGYAYSKDLVNWTRDDSSVGIDVTEGSWDSDMLCYPHAFHCGGNIYLLYNGNEFGRYGFGLAQLETTQ
jgi:hypothetical protein